MHEITHNKKAIAIALFAILLGGCKGGSGGSLGGDNSVTPTPLPPTTPVPTPNAVQISIQSAVSFSEPTTGSKTEFIDVTLSEELTEDLNLNLSAVAISARSDGKFKNYEVPAASFLINAGDTNVRVPIKIINNRLYEENVTLSYLINATPSDKYRFVNNKSKITIVDSNGLPTISFSTPKGKVNEGSSGSFDVTLSHYSSLEVSAEFSASGSASLDDFSTSLTNNRISVSPEHLSGQFTVSAPNDGVDEQDEQIIFKLVKPSDATIDKSNETLTIEIPGNIPTPGPDASEIRVSQTKTIQEPSSGSRVNYVDVTLSKALSSDLTLTVNTKPISAQDSGQFKNYEPVTDLSFIIKAGDTQAKLPVSVVNNNLYESGVTLAYTVSAPPSTEYVIKSDKSVITIENTDALPTIRFNAPNRTLLEGDTKSFALSLDHYSRYPVSVTLETSGTASTDDYSDTLDDSKIVTIPAEKLSLSFDVTAKKDTISEGAEGLRYTLKNPSDVNVVDKENTLDIYIPGDKRFNDTGFVTRYNGTEFDESSTQPEYPNQDADFGLDIDPDMTHDDGRYGFSYSKFDIHGNLIALDRSDYACIRDNTTGLYIERKLDENLNFIDGEPWPPIKERVIEERIKQRLQLDSYKYPEPFKTASKYWQHYDYRYTWYEPNDELNGGSLGAENDTMPEKVPFDIACAIDELSGGDRRCDTAGYLSQMNRFAICGFTDWRLPTPTELKSLINFNVNNNDQGNHEFLQLIHDRTYFTGATSAERTGAAWCVNTVSGQTKLCNKGAYYSVIAVSGGKE